MDKTLIAISNEKSFIKVLHINYINNDYGEQTKVWYIKNHKANDNVIIFTGWLSLEKIRDNLYEFLDRDSIKI